MKTLEHPELIGGTNPLLEGLAPYCPYAKLPGVLRREPLADVPWRDVAPEYRVPLLEKRDEHYWPTRRMLDVADAIQTMLRAGLQARNPLAVSEQRRTVRLALSQNAQEVASYAVRKRALAAIIAAITGMGKSSLAERALQTFAPEQVIYHGLSTACGWSKLAQVTYLIIDAPFNGTRLGLLMRIAFELDALLGTDYAEALRKLRNLDAALVFIVKLLSNHRVGMLIIDENQADNLAESVWHHDFVMFFLSLTNLGIPVLLMGNPLAFGGLECVSQLMRRFSSCGYHRLEPADSAQAPWWRQDLVPGLHRFNLCDEVPAPAAYVDETFPLTGGIPGLDSALWTEAQRVVLRRGGTVARLTMDDVREAAKSPSYVELANIAKQVCTPGSNSRFTDIPASAEVGVAAAPSSSPATTDAMALVRSLVSAHARGQKAKGEKAAKFQEALKNLSTDDLRRATTTAEILAGFSSTCEQTSGKSPPSAAS